MEKPKLIIAYITLSFQQTKDYLLYMHRFILSLIIYITMQGLFCFTPATTAFAEKSWQRDSVPSNILDHGKLGKILKKGNLVTTFPNPDHHRDASFLNGLDPEKTLVEINVEVEKNTLFRLLWAKDDEKYNLERAASVKLKKRVQRYRLYLPRLGGKTRIRIDPSTHPNVIIIKEITFKSLYHLPIQIDSPEEFRAISPENGIGELAITGQGARIVVTGYRPHLEMIIDPKQHFIAGLFKKKRKQSEYNYKSLLYNDDRFPSRLKESSGYLEKPYPVMSIYANAVDLYHPDFGIIPNKQMRGRNWEKPVAVSYYEKGKLLFESNAGMRIHGGKRVILTNSYRLYFRNDYGKDAVTPGIMFSSRAEPLGRLVVHHTAWPPGWSLNNILSYDIARKMGCVTPEIKLAHLVLNGEDKGLFFLTPHQGVTQLASFFGHQDFSSFRYKSALTREAAQFYKKDFTALFRPDDKPLDFNLINKKIDLDNLARHIFSFAFCSTSDYCQGVMARDNKATEPKIFWINWDMDQSFINVSKTIRGKDKYANQKIWEQAGWGRFLGESRTPCKRRDLFKKLVSEYPQYREQVARMATDILNHKVTKTFLLNKLNEYKALLQAWGDYDERYFNVMHNFFSNRHAFMITDIQKWFKMGPSYYCQINAPEGKFYTVDGYRKEGLYKGQYFEGMQATISISEPLAKGFSHWLVNGKRVVSNQLTLPMESDMNISMIFGS